MVIWPVETTPCSGHLWLTPLKKKTFFLDRQKEKSHLWKNIHKIKTVLGGIGFVNISERPLVKYFLKDLDLALLYKQRQKITFARRRLLWKRGGGKLWKFAFANIWGARVSNPARSILIWPNVGYAIYHRTDLRNIYLNQFDTNASISSDLSGQINCYWGKRNYNLQMHKSPIRFIIDVPLIYNRWKWSKSRQNEIMVLSPKSHNAINQSGFRFDLEISKMRSLGGVVHVERGSDRGVNLIRQSRLD